ncbi:MAG: ATP-binding cassette domain-containing protein [Myxococcota bacterium]
MSILSVHHLDVIFGQTPAITYPLLDAGHTRQEIRQKTGHTVAVSNISLSILEGEIVVLMGLSGSGKSSLLRAFNGLNPAARGQVCFKEQPITNFPQFRRSDISMVFQQASLLPNRTVSENIALGLEIKHLDTSNQTRIVSENIERVGLSQWANSFPKELSGGMQQRVGIARALATESSVLLMDEPFSALDPLTRSQLQQELLRLQADLKKTIVFVTHDLNEALLLGNRIVILEEGRVIQIGTPKDIVQMPANAYVERFVQNVKSHCPRCADQSFV